MEAADELCIVFWALGQIGRLAGLHIALLSAKHRSTMHNFGTGTALYKSQLYTYKHDVLYGYILYFCSPYSHNKLQVIIHSSKCGYCSRQEIYA